MFTQYVDYTSTTKTSLRLKNFAQFENTLLPRVEFPPCEMLLKGVDKNATGRFHQSLLYFTTVWNLYQVNYFTRG